MNRLQTLHLLDGDVTQLVSLRPVWLVQVRSRTVWPSEHCATISLELEVRGEETGTDGPGHVAAQVSSEGGRTRDPRQPIRRLTQAS